MADEERTDVGSRKTYARPTLVTIGTVARLTLTEAINSNSEQTTKNGSIAI